MNSEYVTNEEAARMVGLDSGAVKMRLLQARAVLFTHLRRKFGKGKFDPCSRSLVGDDGSILRWQLREHPTEPISYENQQTSVGVVLYLEKVEA